MSTVELRNRIMQLISTDNLDYLKTIYDFAKRTKSEIDPFEELPSTVQEVLLQSLENSDNDEVRPHNEVMSEIKAKFNIAG